MRKYYLPTILFLLGLVLMMPVMVLAAFDDVRFPEDTNVYLTTPAITLTIAAGGQVEAMTVSATNVSFDLLGGSIVTLRSLDRKTLAANPIITTGVCTTNFSYITLQSTTTQTVIVTPGATCATTVTPSGGGAAPAASTEPTAPAPTPDEGTVTASEGGEVSSTTTEEGGAAADVPANAVVANTIVTITPTATTATTVATAVAAVPSGQSVVGSYVYNFAATAAGEAVTTFSEAVTLTFTYTDAQATGFNESTLTIYRWDAITSELVALTSTVNTVTNTVTATTTQFSYFILIGEEVEEEEEEEEVVTPVSEMTITELKAEIVRIAGLIAELQTLLLEMIGEVEGCTVTSFDRNLQLAMSGDDVKCLQVVLNSSADTQVASSGVGSPGNETNYFGSLTKAAVIKFQEKYADEVLTPWELSSGNGFVGSTTREKLNELLVQ